MFYCNKECEYYPCHDMEEINCLFCYCPLYQCEDCGGNYTYTAEGLKDCSRCTLIHKRDSHEYVMSFLHTKFESRPSWDLTFMRIAKVMSARSTCLRRKVGAALVRDNKLLTTGYNGAPSRLAHCSEVGCLRTELNISSGERHELCRAVHAEANTIIQAALHGVSTKGATVYVTVAPCSMCARMLINSGIKRVVFEGDYPDTETRKLLSEAKITFERL